MKKICSLWVALPLLAPMLAFTQTLSPKVMPTAGGYATGTNGRSLSWTLGETFTATLSAGANLLTQGEQQPEISIRTGAVTGSFCAGGPLAVAFTASGYIVSGNVFTAQLSNASGSFAAPVNIGSVSGTASGSIAATVPSGTSAGTGYRIRVVSSMPVFTGSDNGSNLSISSACTLTFSGRIKWSDNMGVGVKDATVTVSGAGTGSAMSNATGDFSVSATGGTGSFSITPVKNINRLNGVTSADVSAIQQHIVGSVPITNPYRLIAADVNRSNSVSSVDASIIQQCLLGNPAALALFNVFWRFVTEANTPLSLPPWGFAERINLTGVTTNQAGLNFVGIKLGDVNGDANPAAVPQALGTPVSWIAEDRPLQVGKEIEVDFRSTGFTDISAYQFALQFDPEALEFQSLQTLNGLPLTAENFGLYKVGEGELRSVWAAQNGVTLMDDTPVFRLTFKALQDNLQLSEVLHLGMEEELGALAYRASLQPSPLLLNFSETTSTTSGAGQSALRLLQNRPNPFAEKTVIGFVLPLPAIAAGEGGRTMTDKPIHLRVYDAEGRLLAEKVCNGAAGYHEETVDLREAAAGVLHYELSTPFGVLARKMVRQ